MKNICMFNSVKKTKFIIINKIAFTMNSTITAPVECLPACLDGSQLLKSS